MADAHIHLQLRPLRELGDDQLTSAYRLKSGSLARTLALPAGSSERAEIAALRGECELFGAELVERGLL